jgi:hypothetical protein
MPIERYKKNSVLDIVHVDQLRLALDEPAPLLEDSLPPVEAVPVFVDPDAVTVSATLQPDLVGATLAAAPPEAPSDDDETGDEPAAVEDEPTAASAPTRARARSKKS